MEKEEEEEDGWYAVNEGGFGDLTVSHTFGAASVHTCSIAAPGLMTRQKVTGSLAIDTRGGRTYGYLPS